MNRVTVLASGAITPADTLTIALVRPADLRPVVMIRWPAKPSITDPRMFAEAASASMRILAAAVTRLTQIRAQQLSETQPLGIHVAITTGGSFQRRPAFLPGPGSAEHPWAERREFAGLDQGG